MCRIVGILDRTSQHLGKDILQMRDAMIHGGPDSAGLFLDGESSLALGHRRLSIIDLNSISDQPMMNEERSIVLAFNGEIYNYLELKEELISLGVTFFSNSDTEVVLKGYQQWSTNCFSRFRGMFAIALYDRRNHQLILARDHAGIKPLYYYSDKDRLYFASEIRSFRSIKNKWKENPHWKVYFLTYGFLPGAQTTLEDVQPLEKGSFIIFDTRTLQSSHYFFFNDVYKEEIADLNEAKEQVRDSLEQAVKRHLIADAPLGVFLSGGIDSSLITILAKKYKPELQTLSITFGDDRYSEEKYQQLIASRFQTDHHSFLVTKEQFTEAIPDIFRAMDQPTTDGINSYFISRFAREAGLKAVLSGLGADELFGGYPSFRRIRAVTKLKKLPGFVLNSARVLPKNKFHKISFLANKTFMSDYLFNRGYFTPAETARLLDMKEEEVSSLVAKDNWPIDLAALSEGNRISYLESAVYMEKQLLRDTDFMSMWYGLEVRVPFLDFDVITTAQKINSSLKFDQEQDKFLLIDSFRDELPREIWDRKKQGFQFPFTAWMQDSLDQFIQTKQAQELRHQFKSGLLSWSRYWAYILSVVFMSS